MHSSLFTRAAAVSAARAILTLAPFNVAAALVIVLGGALGGRAQFVLWAAAAAFEWLTPWIRGTKGFVIAAGHFVERHVAGGDRRDRRVDRRDRSRRVVAPARRGARRRSAARARAQRLPMVDVLQRPRGARRACARVAPGDAACVGLARRLRLLAHGDAVWHPRDRLRRAGRGGGPVRADVVGTRHDPRFSARRPTGSATRCSGARSSSAACARGASTASPRSPRRRSARGSRRRRRWPRSSSCSWPGSPRSTAGPPRWSQFRSGVSHPHKSVTDSTKPLRLRGFGWCQTPARK